MFSLTKYLGLSKADLSYENRLALFEEVYKNHEQFVRRILFWLIPSSYLDDVIQDVFLKIWDKGESFDSRSEIKTWIYRISINTALDFLRKQKKEKTPFIVESRDHNSMEKKIISNDLLKQGINLLPTKIKEPFILFYQEELTLPEIAKILSVNEGTLKSRLHRGREIFLDFLKKEGVQNEF
ncbi:MAG: RNA polymerase sigma factor [Bacteriovoracaceae bacterium]|nr:RNA polymerase sigma factor [Bacteriovoracaceae bacterium]